MNLSIQPRVNTYSNQPKNVAFGCPPAYMVASRIAKQESGPNVARAMHTLQKQGSHGTKSSGKIAKDSGHKASGDMSIDDIAKEQLNIAIRNGFGRR